MAHIRNVFLTLQESSAGHIEPMPSCKSSGYMVTLFLYRTFSLLMMIKLGIFLLISYFLYRKVKMKVSARTSG